MAGSSGGVDEVSDRGKLELRFELHGTAERGVGNDRAVGGLGDRDEGFNFPSARLIPEERRGWKETCPVEAFKEFPDQGCTPDAGRFESGVPGGNDVAVGVVVPFTRPWLKIPIPDEVVSVSNTGGGAEKQAPVEAAADVVIGEDRFVVVPGRALVVWFEVEDWKRRIHVPPGGGRTVHHELKVLGPVYVARLVANKLIPRFVAKFFSGPGKAAGVQGGQAVVPVFEGFASYLFPPVDAAFVVVSIAPQQPDGLISVVACDNICSEAGGIGGYQSASGIGLQERPEGDRCGNETGLVNHLDPVVESLEEGRIDLNGRSFSACGLTRRIKGVAAPV